MLIFIKKMAIPQANLSLDNGLEHRANIGIKNIKLTSSCPQVALSQTEKHPNKLPHCSMIYPIKKSCRWFSGGIKPD